jgi:transcriptional regulator with XRE-family HTH domain
MIDPVARTLGQNVESAMKRRGLSQAELAAKMGMSKTQLNELLDAKGATLTTLFRCAKALGVSIESLVDALDDEYVTLRQPDRSAERFAELLGRLTDHQRELLWTFVTRWVSADEDAQP